MPVDAAVPAQLRHRVFRGSWAVRSGRLTPDQLRGRTWRSLFTDVYVHRDVPVTHALRARAAAGVLRPGSVVTGASAAVLWGVELAPAEDPVELTLPPGTAQVRVTGTRVRRARLDPAWVTRRRGVPVTTPEATAFAQHRVYVGARFVARVDFGWPEAEVAVEYDGLWHAGARQFAEDRRRLNRIQAAGWRVVFVTAADLHDPGRLVARIAAALAA